MRRNIRTHVEVAVIVGFVLSMGVSLILLLDGIIRSIFA